MTLIDNNFFHPGFVFIMLDIPRKLCAFRFITCHRIVSLYGAYVGLVNWGGGGGAGAMSKLKLQTA